MLIIILLIALISHSIRYEFRTEKIHDIEFKLVFWDSPKNISSLKIDIFFNSLLVINNIEYKSGYIQIGDTLINIDNENFRIIKENDYRYNLLYYKEIYDEEIKNLLRKNNNVRIFLEYKIITNDIELVKNIDENIIFSIKKERITILHDLMGLIYLMFNH